MPRDLPVGNGSMLVNFDSRYQMRDIYFPYVGQENHTVGHPCRFGVWTDGRFSWVHDDGWERRLEYAPNQLITQVHLYHSGLKLHLACRDMVDCDQNIYFKKITVRNEADHRREVRLLFHHDFHIYGHEYGDTAYYEPVNDVIIHYKNQRYFLLNGVGPERTDDDPHKTLFQYCTGVKEFGGHEGTWRDAEDGALGMNPITQGSVDSTFSLRCFLDAGATGEFYYWIVAETAFFPVRNVNLQILEKGPEYYFDRTERHWLKWLAGRTRAGAGLPEPLAALYDRSLLIVRSQIDNHGAIIAANDGDSREFNKDTYSYMWPRDGALVAHALDMAGYPDLTRRFFEFCADRMPPRTFYHEGYLLHKFNPDGSLGSSWHPWVREGKPQLPIQEDETALVLWSLWHHFLRWRDAKFIEAMFERLIQPAARFLMHYRDPDTGLPRESFDLWEERYGVLTFTTCAVVAGLAAAANLARALKRDALAAECQLAADTMREAMKRILYRPELGRYARMVTYAAPRKLQVDPVLDSSLYALFAFGVFPARDPHVVQTMRQIEQKLRVKTGVGGIARYTNDYYYQMSQDVANVPGNPWIICTLWLALWLIELAESEADLEWPLDILRWTADHALPSGVLAEQIHPHSGAPLSVSPLTWSHATYIEAVAKLARKRVHLKPAGARRAVRKVKRLQNS